MIYGVNSACTHVTHGWLFRLFTLSIIYFPCLVYCLLLGYYTAFCSCNAGISIFVQLSCEQTQCRRCNHKWEGECVHTCTRAHKCVRLLLHITAFMHTKGLGKSSRRFNKILPCSWCIHIFISVSLPIYNRNYSTCSRLIAPSSHSSFFFFNAHEGWYACSRSSSERLRCCLHLLREWAEARRQRQEQRGTLKQRPVHTVCATNYELLEDVSNPHGDLDEDVSNPYDDLLEDSNPHNSLLSSFTVILLGRYSLACGVQKGSCGHRQWFPGRRQHGRHHCHL